MLANQPAISNIGSSTLNRQLVFMVNKWLRIKSKKCRNHVSLLACSFFAVRFHWWLADGSGIPIHKRIMMDDKLRVPHVIIAKISLYCRTIYAVALTAEETLNMHPNTVLLSADRPQNGTVSKASGQTHMAMSGFHLHSNFRYLQIARAHAGPMLFLMVNWWSMMVV